MHLDFSTKLFFKHPATAKTETWAAEGKNRRDQRHIFAFSTKFYDSSASDFKVEEAKKELIFSLFV